MMELLKGKGASGKVWLLFGKRQVLAEHVSMVMRKFPWTGGRYGAENKT